MQIKYFAATWGMTLPSLEANVRKIKAGGYAGVEMGAPASAAERQALRALLDELGLDLIVQVYTTGGTPEEHAASFEVFYCQAVELRPRMINSHTGKDFFSPDENMQVLKRAEALEREMGVPVAHEIHRGRATFSAPAAMALIERMPQIRFAADLSHWCCVHESLLKDQPERVERAIQHAYHIHARVGHPEGPQVNDPRAPEWSEAVETHLGWWQRIIDHHKALNTPEMTVTTEFGPPGYMPTLPYTRQPVVDLWEVNLYMRELLKSRLNWK
jgi:sugar phosphate isomerase/epimerase